MPELANGVVVMGSLKPEYRLILSPEAMQFVAKLHRAFNVLREKRLHDRIERQKEIDSGRLPDFLPQTRHIREKSWSVAPTPSDLLDRRVEITGPSERKMMINALNSGASVFMADFEDALSPTWANVVQGQINCHDAVRKSLAYYSPDGKHYELNTEGLATLFVRPRGWHLLEHHVLIDGQPVSASLFDFGLYFFHNVHELINRGTGPYFYLPKLESHLEARLWSEVFALSEEHLGIPHGTIRATVLIETILAAFEMDEILYELRDYATGLNAGRWDYIFSIIKKMHAVPNFMLPDRGTISMAVPFMRAYAQLVVQTCHKRGAHAMGGMSAFVPSRKDPKVNEVALAKVREDKLREVADGFDGTWVAHPDLVTIAKDIFSRVLGTEPNQKHKRREDFHTNAQELLNFKIPDGKITEAGMRNNIHVALQYLQSWLRGTGAVTIHNLMEDAATAEIARAQLWLWVQKSPKLDNGMPITRQLYLRIRDEEYELLRKTGEAGLDDAKALLDDLVLGREFAPFLTSFANATLNAEMGFVGLQSTIQKDKEVSHDQTASHVRKTG